MKSGSRVMILRRISGIFMKGRPGRGIGFRGRYVLK